MSESGREIRLAARGGFCVLTVGRARGFVQANLVLLPENYASEFETFCRANDQACPLIAVGKPGDAALDGIAADLDLRSDLPGYLVHEGGAPRPTREIRAEWRDDLVAFAIGCWFGAEAALARHGVRMRHAELGLQGPLFRTGLPAVHSGRFGGPLVVSMRPFAIPDADRVRAITSKLPRRHGAPVHVGDPAELGIPDVDRPDWGERLRPEAGEIALFWACGLTALAALQNARLPFFITHAPGAMLVTDLRESEIS